MQLPERTKGVEKFRCGRMGVVFCSRNCKLCRSFQTTGEGILRGRSGCVVGSAVGRLVLELRLAATAQTATQAILYVPTTSKLSTTLC